MLNNSADNKVSKTSSFPHRRKVKNNLDKGPVHFKRSHSFTSSKNIAHVKFDDEENSKTEQENRYTLSCSEILRKISGEDVKPENTVEDIHSSMEEEEDQSKELWQFNKESCSTECLPHQDDRSSISANINDIPTRPPLPIPESHCIVCCKDVQKHEDEDMVCTNCEYHTCNSCMHLHLKAKVTDGFIILRCPNNSCTRIITDEEVELYCKEIAPLYMKNKVDAQNNPRLKSCPSCDKIQSVPEPLEIPGKTTCPSCNAEWCAKCHSSWHIAMTCSEYLNVEEDAKLEKKVEESHSSMEEEGDQSRESLKIVDCCVTPDTESVYYDEPIDPGNSEVINEEGEKEEEEGTDDCENTADSIVWCVVCWTEFQKHEDTYLVCKTCKEETCNSCMHLHLKAKVTDGFIMLRCPNNSCIRVITDEEVELYCKEIASLYMKNKVDAQNNPRLKSCPGCNKIHSFPEPLEIPDKTICSSCSVEWCAKCHSPWHNGMTCSMYQKDIIGEGKKALKIWAKSKGQATANARKCPACKCYIERTTGCNHMFCPRCETDFCYVCGKKHRRAWLFGNHSSRYRWNGCKYNLAEGKPALRIAIRSGVLVGTFLAAPLVASLALSLGCVLIAVSPILVPVVVVKKKCWK